jgi:hypothetical protein
VMYSHFWLNTLIDVSIKGKWDNVRNSPPKNLRPLPFQPFVRFKKAKPLRELVMYMALYTEFYSVSTLYYLSSTPYQDTYAKCGSTAGVTECIALCHV